ncbi:helix-turn-helix transcriptional regulator [Collinsella vaginalis]|uniref:helix-turn-helix transcriptional regulator n=1 Tax=Collinsella vaginalis TaxID=1870987 RepID=UPI000A266F5C|nr:helix-turn-helix transcriptional regulator [Collinsella vaginalis]
MGLEIGNHIRGLRTNADMSQDELAARVYVSRQTISSWENGRTFPDIQSLLLLSKIFRVTADSLIKGDVETMAKTIDSGIRTFRNLSVAMLALIALAAAAGIWFTTQTIIWNWPLEHAVPTLLLVALFAGAAIFAAFWVEKIKLDHDLVIYQEVLAFYEGREPDRSTAVSRRRRLAPWWMKALRIGGMAILGGIAGFLVMYVEMAIVDSVLG